MNIILLALCFPFIASANPGIPANLAIPSTISPQAFKEGRYTGWIQIKGKTEKVATSASFFLSSNEGLRSFPTLHASLTFFLGGFASFEYFSEHYEVKYDYDLGALVLDDPKADFFAQLKANRKEGRTRLEGDFYLRSLGLKGRMELVEDSDEPSDEFEDLRTFSTPEKYLNTIDGQYEGKCDKEDALLQLQTIRGLKIDGNENDNLKQGFNKHYDLLGRLAVKKGGVCGKQQKNYWCTLMHFYGGNYSPFHGSMTLHSDRSSQDCQVGLDSIQCKIKMFDRVSQCQFQRKNILTNAGSFYGKSYFLSPSKLERENLPSPNPPANEKLSAALDGTFTGYIHNEHNNTYLPLKLDVVPYSSTDNPHNPNQMMITSTAFLWLGGASVTQRFESTSFYLHPGFALQGKKTDITLSLKSWRIGHIQGEVQSKAMGRLGSFELIKGEKFPILNSKAKVVGNTIGTFERSTRGVKQWLRFVNPSAVNINDHLFFSGGSYQTIVGNTPIREIKKAVFDPYTLRLGWLNEGASGLAIGTGFLESTGDLNVFWPPSPTLGTQTSLYEGSPFKKIQENQNE